MYTNNSAKKRNKELSYIRGRFLYLTGIKLV